MTTKTALTIKDIEAGYENSGWLGFGYLGVRRNALDTSDPEAITDPAQIARVDDAALTLANAKGWSPERFFAWLNSKDGRWFAESLLHSDDTVARASYLVR